MTNFNTYLKDKEVNGDLTNNQAKREGNGIGSDVPSIKGVTASKMRTLQEKLDPKIKEDFMDVAIDVMRRNRDKPQYNTAELKKIAALLDNLRFAIDEYSKKIFLILLSFSCLIDMFCNDLSKQKAAARARGTYAYSLRGAQGIGASLRQRNLTSWKS